MEKQLPKINVLIGVNGFWEGVILRRHLTFDEAFTIAELALGVNTDLITDDWRARFTEEEEDISEEMIEFTSDVEGLFIGTNTWDSFCNRWTCDAGLDDICPAMFLQMISVASDLKLL